MKRLTIIVIICGVTHLAFSQNFGIGTASPNAKLEVAGNNIRISSSGDAKFEYFGSSGDRGFVGWQTSPATGVALWNRDNTPIFFGTTNAERMRIDAAGNVGIGTTAPGAKLHVSNGNASYALFGPNSSWNSYLYVGAGTSTISSGRAQVISTNGNLHLDAGNGQDIYIAYYNGSNTFINPQGGNVGVGTTSPGYKLHVNGTVGLGQTDLLSSDIYFTNTGHSHSGLGNTSGHAAIENAANYNTLMILGRANGIGNVRSVSIWDRLNVNGVAYSTGGFYTGSDARWKENIHPITGALGMINALQGVRYNWKKDTEQYKNGITGPEIGVIAQEVERVVPEAVSEIDEEGHKAVAYEKLVPILIEAVKEQQQTIEKQQQTIDKLGQRVNALETK